MRQTDTKPLTRLITDEVEMINLHSTIWGTVQIVKITWGKAVFGAKNYPMLKCDF